MPTQSIHLSRTKIIVPKRRNEILTRTRLLELLYELLDKRLILISAPAGYGKTSLLIDFVSHAEMPLCWLSLDALDQDPQRFIAYFIAALAQRFPKFGRQSTAALSNITSLEEDTERLIVTLVNEIYEQISEHFILVLDDYQFVNDTPAIRDFVNRFVQLMGENCHLIISSRKVVTLPDAILMIARDQVGGLGPLELAFAAEEIQALFEQNYHEHISTDTAEELVQQTEGWITALQLSNPTMAKGIADRLRAARAAGVELFDYLSQEVLDQQPAELRAFLLQTSLLDEFDVSLCAAVLSPLTPDQPHNWKRMIEAVLLNNLFVLPVGPGGKWLRYHHLFQDFLKFRLQKEQPELIGPIYRRLAQVHEQGGEWEKSYHVYQQLRDVNALADLVERAGTILLYNDRLITLSKWLEHLPDELIRARPVLLSLQGAVAVMKGKVQSGLSLLDQAEIAFRSSGDVANQALTLIRRAFARLYLGNYTASLADADYALSLTAEDDSHKSTYGVAMRVKGLSLHRMGQVSQAVECLAHALEICDELNETQNIPRIQMELGMVHWVTGNYNDAQFYYERALSLWQKEGNLFWQANLLNNMGVMYHSQGEYEQAVTDLEEGLSCARRSGHTRMEALNLASLGDLYADLEEMDAAQQAYQQAQEIAIRIDDNFLNRYLMLMQASIARVQGDYAQTQSLLDLAQEQIYRSGSNYEKGLLHLERGRFLLATGNSQEATNDLLVSEQCFVQGDLLIETGWSRLWLAAACNRLHDKVKTQEYIQAALSVVKSEQPAHSLIMVARQIRTWLADSQNSPEYGSSLRELLKQADQMDTKLPALRRHLRRMTSAVPLSFPRLTVRAFGKAQVRVNGKLVTSSQWQTQEARNLFFYFLESPQAVTKEQVGIEFWPDLSPAQLKVKFKNNIYRLRRALGQDTIFFENEFYQFNRILDYDYDVEAFKAQIAQANAARNIRERITCYQTAVALVKGTYLEDIDAAWARFEREQLNQEYLSALLNLGELYRESGELPRALQTCQRAITHDACLEEAHRQAMRIYAAMGDRAAIARQYQACKEALKSELDVPPSPETEELYKNLMA
ncbi:MAG: tetratricopeptide repeat protein [Chloroflexi bacterium]|nr:tetratricopeptide repeat protein [Chloroflexota bacterium]